MVTLTNLQRVALVLLRTVIGWHFLYEGYYKLVVPGWSREGALLARWSAAGYLRGASGPLADVFHHLASPSFIVWIDRLMPAALLAIGLSLILGLLTQLGGFGALLCLTMFYLAAIPTSGVPQAGAEGAYLIVNKTLVEAAAVLLVLVFRTGQIAGLDLIVGSRFTRRRRRPAFEEAGGRV